MKKRFFLIALVCFLCCCLIAVMASCDKNGTSGEKIPEGIEGEDQNPNGKPENNGEEGKPGENETPGENENPGENETPGENENPGEGEKPDFGEGTELPIIPIP